MPSSQRDLNARLVELVEHELAPLLVELANAGDWEAHSLRAHLRWYLNKLETARAA